MAKGPRPDAAKETFWRKCIARQRKSGLTIRAFCRQEGLSEPSMYGWRREIARRDASRSDGPSPQPRGGVLAQSASAVSGRMTSRGNAALHSFDVEPCRGGAFLPVRIASPAGTAAEGTGAAIEIVLSTPPRIIIRSGVDGELLRQVAEILGAVAPGGAAC